MNTFFSIYWVLVSSIWYFGNGILHDIFVIQKHKGGYDRELLRLLMDGHVLILSGILLYVSYLMMLNKIQFGAVLGIIISLGMLIYCLMIFPFLKSIVTMIISSILLAVSIRAFNTFPDIYEIMKPYK